MCLSVDELAQPLLFYWLTPASCRGLSPSGERVRQRPLRLEPPREARAHGGHRAQGLETPRVRQRRRAVYPAPHAIRWSVYPFHFRSTQKNIALSNLLADDATVRSDRRRTLKHVPIQSSEDDPTAADFVDIDANELRSLLAEEFRRPPLRAHLIAQGGGGRVPEPEEAAAALTDLLMAVCGDAPGEVAAEGPKAEAASVRTSIRSAQRPRADTTPLLCTAPRVRAPEACPL